MPSSIAQKRGIEFEKEVGNGEVGPNPKQRSRRLGEGKMWYLLIITYLLIIACFAKRKILDIKKSQFKSFCINLNKLSLYRLS